MLEFLGEVTVTFEEDTTGNYLHHGTVYIFDKLGGKGSIVNNTNVPINFISFYNNWGAHTIFDIDDILSSNIYHIKLKNKNDVEMDLYLQNSLYDDLQSQHKVVFFSGGVYPTVFEETSDPQTISIYVERNFDFKIIAINSDWKDSRELKGFVPSSSLGRIIYDPDNELEYVKIISTDISGPYCSYEPMQVKFNNNNNTNYDKMVLLYGDYLGEWTQEIIDLTYTNGVYYANLETGHVGNYEGGMSMLLMDSDAKPSLPETGPISLAMVNQVLGKSSNSLISLNDSDVRSLAGISSGTISISDLRGKSSLKKFRIAICQNGGYNTDFSIKTQDSGGYIKSKSSIPAMASSAVYLFPKEYDISNGIINIETDPYALDLYMGGIAEVYGYKLKGTEITDGLNEFNLTGEDFDDECDIVYNSSTKDYTFSFPYDKLKSMDADCIYIQFLVQMPPM